MGMFNLKDTSVKSLGVHILKITPGIIGCSVFLSSIVSSFYCPTLWRKMDVTPSDHYWSYKHSKQGCYIFSSGQGSRQLYPYEKNDWFGDFWLRNQVITEYGLSWIFILMFAYQIITLTTGILSVFCKRLFSLTPIISCITVIIIMTYTNISLSGINLALDSYQLGYWLTYPCVALFIVHFIIKAKLD